MQTKQEAARKRWSAVGVDGGLATCGIAHVRRVERDVKTHVDRDYELVAGRTFAPGSDYADSSAAEAMLLRARDLHAWARTVLGQAVLAGAESFHAERFEYVREATASAKYAAGHTALALACAQCDPRPARQRHGSGLPEYVAARDAKRAATGCAEATKRVVIAAAARLICGADSALRGLLAESRPHLADAAAVALCALGHRERPVLVAAAGLLPAALARLAQVSPRGRSIEDAFTAREMGLRGPYPLNSWEAGRALVFAGRRSAAALGLHGRTAPDPLRWCELRFETDSRRDVACMAALLPDPADERWWGRSENAARARTFLRAAARMP